MAGDYSLSFVRDGHSINVKIVGGNTIFIRLTGVHNPEYDLGFKSLKSQP